MNPQNIPKALHYLIPIAKEWGIGDDGYRDEKVENSTNEELEVLVEYFTDEVAVIVNNWLGYPSLNEPQTVEYYKFTSLFMVFEYANAVLKDRKG